MRRVHGVWATVLAAVLAGTSNAPAQSPSNSPDAMQPQKKIYTRAPQFRLPFNLEESDRVRIRDVQLFVKSGDEPWAKKDSAGPASTHFSFRASRDGEYWFTVVIVDKSGTAVPADVTHQPPGLVVVVDTVGPEIDVKESPTAGGLPSLRCDVTDLNPDPTSVRLEYQKPDGSWKPLTAADERRINFTFTEESGWPDENEWTGKVRASAADLAGNSTTREFIFRPRPVGAGRVENRVEKPFSPPMLSTESVQTVPRAAPAERSNASPDRQYVNSTHVSLDYHIEQQGPSGVGKVEVWMTRDAGQNWKRLCDDPDKRSPVDFDLPGEGVFGVTLVVSNGNGVGDPPPMRGDAPDLWIEVDLTKPVAQFHAAHPGSGNDAGFLLFSYEARDKNLGPEPISFFSAPRREGPWTPIARGLKNDGIYRWQAPRDAGMEIYFRLEVADLAGNTTRVDLPDRVVLDPSRPRARVLGVSAGSARTLPPP
jgi:hypothetical protein